ncbi:tail fiber protein [Paenibacillus oenotherae]|uniref:Tail fiber protein n=1 Tax=Paenibacillus oenotherae TaxID=1435645 RepID=A0ABS7D803_9BACL|nr:tail fiber protein [Paenibacillus oenotherae]MBW7476072.1 tail fiber protein [Paenibacillus oenotherae]
MSDQYVGEIRMFGGNFAPVGWLPCDGRILSISQYEVLYVLLGTTYGGDGNTTFALPDLRGRIPFSMGRSTTGTNYVLGQRAGVESVTLTSQQMPAHTHLAAASDITGTIASPSNNYWGGSTEEQYSTETADGRMDVRSLTPTGGNQPHDNMMPSLVISFIIATEGIFPSQG